MRVQWMARRWVGGYDNGSEKFLTRYYFFLHSPEVRGFKDVSGWHVRREIVVRETFLTHLPCATFLPKLEWTFRDVWNLIKFDLQLFTVCTQCLIPPYWNFRLRSWRMCQSVLRKISRRFPNNNRIMVIPIIRLFYLIPLLTSVKLLAENVYIINKLP